eukprot:2044094-Alexandrium_andersonii.AAC.1
MRACLGTAAAPATAPAVALLPHARSVCTRAGDCPRCTRPAHCCLRQLWGPPSLGWACGRPPWSAPLLW